MIRMPAHKQRTLGDIIDDVRRTDELMKEKMTFEEWYKIRFKIPYDSMLKHGYESAKLIKETWEVAQENK